MKIKEKFEVGELVLIGVLEDVNTPENLINLSVQIGKKAGKRVAIYSERVAMWDLPKVCEGKFPEEISLQENMESEKEFFLSLPKKGVILIDSLTGYPEFTRMIKGLSYHAKTYNTTVVVIATTAKVKDNDGKDIPDLRYVDGYRNFINYCNRAFLWKRNDDDFELALCHISEKSMGNEVSNWLLRRDGEVFPMEYDVIIDGEPSSEVQLSNIVWLFEHTLREETKRHITAFIRKLCITNGYPWEMEYIDENLGSQLKNIAEYECDSAGYLEIYDYFDKVLFDFDEEFLHVCFGGEYHPIPGNRDLFFRISSEDYDWANVIEGFKSKTGVVYVNEHITVDKHARKRNPKVGTKDEGDGLWYFYG